MHSQSNGDTEKEEQCLLTKRWFNHYKSFHDDGALPFQHQNDSTCSTGNGSVYFLHIDSLTPNWPVPSSLKADIHKKTNSSLAYTLTMTYYHAGSDRKCFYGNTYTPDVVSYNQTNGSITTSPLFLFCSKQMDLQNSLVVVELVAIDHNDDTGHVDGRYSCGWCLINLAQGYGETPIFCGTPRHLFIDAVYVESGAKLGFRSHIVTDSMVHLALHGIGASSKTDTFIPVTDDMLPGLDIQIVHLSHQTNPESISNVDIRLSTKVPWRVQILQSRVKFGENRQEYESRLIEWILSVAPRTRKKEPVKNRMFKLTRKKSPQPKRSMRDREPYPVILSRKIKFAVHNGYSYIPFTKTGKVWKELELNHYDDSVDGIIELDTFHQHPLCAIIVVVEYSINVLQAITNVALGCGIYIPFGKKKEEETWKDKVTCLPLIPGETCRLFTHNQIFSPVRSIRDMAENPLQIEFHVRPMCCQSQQSNDTLKQDIPFEGHNSDVPGNESSFCIDDNNQDGSDVVAEPKESTTSTNLERLNDGDNGRIATNPTQVVEDKDERDGTTETIDTEAEYHSPNRDRYCDEDSSRILECTDEVLSHSPNALGNILIDTLDTEDHCKDAHGCADLEAVTSSPNHSPQSSSDSVTSCVTHTPMLSTEANALTSYGRFEKEVIDLNDSIGNKKSKVSTSSSPCQHLAETTKPPGYCDVKESQEIEMSILSSRQTNDAYDDKHETTIVKARRLLETGDDELKRLVHFVKSEIFGSVSTSHSTHREPDTDEFALPYKKRCNFVKKHVEIHGSSPFFSEALIEAMAVDWYRREKKNEFVSNHIQARRTAN